MLPNCHIPTPSATAAFTPATDSIHIFVEDRTPGIMSMEAIKIRKRSIEVTAESQYTQERHRLSRGSPTTSFLIVTLISISNVSFCVEAKMIHCEHGVPMQLPQGVASHCDVVTLQRENTLVT